MTMLIINEKPSQARNFAKALGGESGIYNGESYKIVALRGHLYEFAKPEKQVAEALADKYHSWNLENLPWNASDIKWKRSRQKDVSSVISKVVAEAKGVNEIVIATDDDPTGEGELLAWEVLDENNIRAPKFSRMYFADEAPASIQKAFKSRKPIQSMATDMDYVKAYYRARWDWMSMQFTRIATKYGDGRSVLRQGRLKSAMVLLVGDQLKLVDGYKKIPYYQNRFRDENGNVYTNPEEPQFPKKEDVPQTYTDSPVVVDSKTMKSSAPQRLIDLARLSSMLSSKGIKAKTVLNTYQKMYEAQVVSYPRTEDKCITEEQFNELLPKVDEIARLVGVDPSILTHRAPRTTHVKTGMAHGANRPGLNVPKDLNALDSMFGAGAAEIYKILAKNYLAMLAEDYEYEQQKGHVQKYPKFVATVNVPVKMGWKAVSMDAADDDDENNSSKGLGTHANPFVHEGFPPKPQQPTMKWLMTQLEKHDVGTGATRTSTYAEVTSSRTKYPLLEEKRGKISMTMNGQMSYGLLPGTHIGDITITEKVMSDMKLIAQGKADPEKLLDEMAQMVIDDMQTMKKNSVQMRKELGVVADGKFPQKEKYEGIWNGREVSFSREYCSHRFTDEECEKLCAGETIEVSDFVSSKTGKKFAAVGKLEDQEYNGHNFVGFKPDFSAKTDSIPGQLCGHTFTAPELKALENGESVHIDGAVSKAGKKFNCDVTWGKKDDGTMGFTFEFGSASDNVTGVWKGKNVSFKRNFRGHELTDEECEQLLAGEKIEIRGLKAKSGNTYGVLVNLGDYEYNGGKYFGVNQLEFLSN